MKLAHIHAWHRALGRAKPEIAPIGSWLVCQVSLCAGGGALRWSWGRRVVQITPDDYELAVHTIAAMIARWWDANGQQFPADEDDSGTPDA